jgi:hypothetical protein
MVGLLVIECEELLIYIFFVEGPLYVSQKTKDNTLVPICFLGEFYFFLQIWLILLRNFFLDLTKINK